MAKKIAEQNNIQHYETNVNVTMHQLNLNVKLYKTHKVIKFKEPQSINFVTLQDTPFYLIN